MQPSLQGARLQRNYPLMQTEDAYYDDTLVTFLIVGVAGVLAFRNTC